MQNFRKVGIALLTLAILIVFWRSLLVIVALLAVLILAFAGWEWLAGSTAARRFRLEYHPLGKNLLLVYSNSPHWQSYVETNWLPRWKHRAVILNWSERSTWNRDRPEVALFHAMASQREYNPLAIVVPTHGRPIVVRFWKAFRDYKHGKDQKLKQQEAELERLLELHP